MQEKLHNFFNRNQELTKIALYFFAALAIFFFFVIVFYLSSRQESHTYTDSVSGETVNTLNTGAIAPDGPSFIGLEQISSNFDSGLFVDLKARLSTFFKNTLPQVEKISYRKDSFTAADGVASFSLVTDNGKNFFVQVTGNSQSDYQLTVTHQGTIVLSYSAPSIAMPTKDPTTLADLLPHTVDQSEIPTVTVVKRGRERGALAKYEISVNSCGDQAIKDCALELVNEWLEARGYDPKDFNFSIPNYCDGGAS